MNQKQTVSDSETGSHAEIARSEDSEGTAPSDVGSEVRSAAKSVFDECNALQLASVGGTYSPWILGVYFATDGLDPIFLLETSGKTFANLQIEKSVAFIVSQNDAMKDFIQGSATAELLDGSEEERVRGILVAKMPWYKTYTPTTPIRLRVKQLFVSSFSRNWFPARTLRLS